MKASHTKAILALLGLGSFSLSLSAQNYSVDSPTISAGGGASSGGNFSVAGTIGQSDASSQPMRGGNYSITGGFWSMISILQTTDAPTLFMSHSGAVVSVYWQNIPGWSLYQNSNLELPANWSINNAWTTSNGTNYLPLVSPIGNLFFRLGQP